MTLTSVVFPEPLGPMSPRISPSPSSKLTWETAASPPNRLVTPRASRRAMRLDPVLAQVPGEVPERELPLADHLGQPLRHEQHHQDHDQAVEELGQAHELRRQDF